jgi:hypothetical protein
MMQTADVQSVMGVMQGMKNAASLANAPASRNMPRGGFNIAVKRVNDPYRTRSMAVPVAATEPVRYMAGAA